MVARDILLPNRKECAQTYVQGELRYAVGKAKFGEECLGEVQAGGGCCGGKSFASVDGLVVSSAAG